MVSIQKISWVTHQKLGNLPSQTSNFGCATKLLNFVACLAWALELLTTVYEREALQAQFNSLTCTSVHLLKPLQAWM